MRSTLFFIPHEIAGIPLFGFGLLLGCLAVGLLGWIIWSIVKKRTNEIAGGLPLFGIAAAIVTFLLPMVEQNWSDGSPIGLPIRGYGILVLLGLFCGIGLTVYRGRQLGISPDTIIGLGFWMMLTGVIGARVFYVVQKWDEFQSFGQIFQLTEGGLVIYGGVIGGLLAGVTFAVVHKMKIPAIADLIAPGFLIGLCLGRIGCLLHGCCFGGVCEAELPAIRFPHGSGPYQAQLLSGKLLGITTTNGRLPGKIAMIASESPAAKQGIPSSGQLEGVFRDEVPLKKGDDPTVPPLLIAQANVSGKSYTFLPVDLPERSLPTHPSQIYSATNALLLCILIWFLQPLPSRDGVAFCVAILLYALSRFLLEGVRSDEAGQLGTTMTIAQLVAILSVFLASMGLIAIYRLPSGRSWTWTGSPPATASV